MFSSTTSALSSACSCAIAHFADLFRASAALLNVYILRISILVELLFTPTNCFFQYPDRFLPCLGGNFLDLKGGKGLAMTSFHAIGLTPSLFEDQNLLGLILLYDAGHNLGPVENGLANLDLLSIGNEENIGQFNGVTNIAGKFLNPNTFAR
jgi:hypothetical protein